MTTETAQRPQMAEIAAFIHDGGITQAEDANEAWGIFAERFPHATLDDVIQAKNVAVSIVFQEVAEDAPERQREFWATLNAKWNPPPAPPPPGFLARVALAWRYVWQSR